MDKFKAGKQIQHFQQKHYKYESFLPSRINHSFIIKDQEIIFMLEKAIRFLGELNAYSKLIPDIDYFIQMHVRSEAVSSSKIEGTKTGMNEVLLSEEDIDPKKRDDWHEVQNYIKAMNWAINNLNKLPVSERLIKKTHKVLLSGVRGEGKMPGKLRKSQNWIGGATVRTAHFIPPHHEKIPELLSDWEQFWHNKGLDVPILIRVAIGHYQFETIHPFLDGNGRIGRLLITLQLIERGFIKKPVLYLSDYFEKNRQAYYDSLDIVRQKNDLEQWIKFFLEGVIITAKKGKKTFENIIELRESYEAKILKLGRKVSRARKLLLYLFSNPIVSVNKAKEVVGSNYNSTNRLVKDFVKLGILEEITGFSRNRLFKMTDYVALFR